ncbi:hypothetical protein CPB84DRAFT_1964338 [Gymnopilus junonius]|uniref:Uncharacterized protein n=1 Tax=Gymnopilus junonius TaxID=109634 RepID=A0A9P5NIW7_GYMJU|nr:hypothetical protein CPB84DRAFT_1964338 [Gymnopilus junonius]
MTQDPTNAISNIDHNLPDLPSEILYKILDEVYEVGRQSSISSIALVCNSFRIHSNKYRFAKLGLEGDDITLVPKVHALQDLIKSEAKSSDEEGMVGFMSFVKSFSISPSGPNYRQTLDDRSLAFIIRNLFLPSQDRNVYPSGTSRQFSLSPIVNRDKLLLWPSLNDDLVSAFYVLSVHSDSTLKTSIPSHLLKFLDIHHTVSLPEIMNIVSNGASKPDSDFSCLTIFNTLIRHEAPYQTTHTIFSAAKNLQKVTVFAFGLKKGSKESFLSMDYSQIFSLQSLCEGDPQAGTHLQAKKLYYHQSILYFRFTSILSTLNYAFGPLANGVCHRAKYRLVPNSTHLTAFHLAVQLNVSQWRDTPRKYIADTLITLVGDVGKHPPNLTCIKVVVEEFIWLMGTQTITDLFRGFRALDTHLSNLGFMGRIVVHVRLEKCPQIMGTTLHVEYRTVSQERVSQNTGDTNIITEIIPANYLQGLVQIYQYIAITFE